MGWLSLKKVFFSSLKWGESIFEWYSKRSYFELLNIFNFNQFFAKMSFFQSEIVVNVWNKFSIEIDKWPSSPQNQHCTA